MNEILRKKKNQHRFTYENEWTGFGRFSVRSWRQSWNLSKTNFRLHIKINVIKLCEFEHFHFIRKIAPCNSRSSALFLDYSTIKLELDATYTLECHTWKLDVLTCVCTTATASFHKSRQAMFTICMRLRWISLWKCSNFTQSFSYILQIDYSQIPYENRQQP